MVSSIYESFIELGDFTAENAFRHIAGSNLDGTRSKQIPDVRNFEVFRKVSTKNEYKYGFSMEFANREEYNAYNNHPLHVEYVQNRWETEVEQFLEIDFQDVRSQ